MKNKNRVQVKKNHVHSDLELTTTWWKKKRENQSITESSRPNNITQIEVFVLSTYHSRVSMLSNLHVYRYARVCVYVLVYVRVCVQQLNVHSIYCYRIYKYIEMIFLYSCIQHAYVQSTRRWELKHQRRLCVVCVYVFGFLTHTAMISTYLLLIYIGVYAMDDERTKTWTQYNRRTHMYVQWYVQFMEWINKWTFIY